MGNLNIATTIALIAGNIAQARAAAKVLGASYKKVEQINRMFLFHLTRDCNQIFILNLL